MIFLLICPLYVRSLGSCIHAGIQFMYQNCFIHIKQKYYLSQIRLQTGTSLTLHRKQYRRLHSTMAHVLDLTREIKAYDRFYSPYVTALIISLGCLGSSILNVTLQAISTAPVYLTMPWILYSGGFYFFVFLFNYFSSITLRLNFAIFKRLLQLQTTLLSVKCLNRRQVVKLDLVNEYKAMLRKCSFRLVNSSLINNRLFAFEIFGCFSVFYMKLVTEDPLF